MRWLLAAVVLVLAVLVFWRLSDGLVRGTVPAAASPESPGSEPGVRLPVQVVAFEGGPAAGLRLLLGLEPAEDCGQTPVLASAVSAADGSAWLWLPRRRWERLAKSTGPLHLVARFPALQAPQVAFDPRTCLETGEPARLRLPPASRLVVELLEADGELSARAFRLYAAWRPADPEVPSWPQTPEILVPAGAGRAVVVCGKGLRFDLWVARPDGSGRKALAGAAGPVSAGEELTVQRQLPEWKGPPEEALD